MVFAAVAVALSVGVGVFMTAVFAVLVTAIFLVVRVVMAMGMAVRVRMLVVLVVVVVRLGRFGPPRTGELPDRHCANRGEYDEGNPAEEDPDEEHRREDSADHPGLVHQDRNHADGPAGEDRETLVKKVRSLAFAVAVSVSMGMSHFAPSLSAAGTRRRGSDVRPEVVHRQ